MPDLVLATMIASVGAGWAGPVAILSFLVAAAGVWLTFKRDRHVEVKDEQVEHSATIKVMIDGYVDLIPALQSELKRAREDREYINGRLSTVTAQYEECEKHSAKLEIEMRKMHRRVAHLEEELAVYTGRPPA